MSQIGQTTLGDKVTEQVLFGFRSFATLPYDLQIEPFVSDEDAKSERVVVKTEIGEQYLEADQGFNATLTVVFKTVERDAAKANDKWAKAEQALYEGLETSASNARGITIFSRLDFLTENATTTIDNSDNFRKYTRTIPMHVKLL